MEKIKMSLKQLENAGGACVVSKDDTHYIFITIKHPEVPGTTCVTIDVESTTSIVNAQAVLVAHLHKVKTAIERRTNLYRWYNYLNH